MGRLSRIRPQFAASVAAALLVTLVAGVGARAAGGPTNGSFEWSVRGAATVGRTTFAIVGRGSFSVDETGQIADGESAAGSLVVGVTGARRTSSNLWVAGVHGPGDYTPGRALLLEAEVETTARGTVRSSCGGDPFGSLVLYQAQGAKRGRLVLSLCGQTVVVPRAVLTIEPSATLENDPR